jgi:hypothetical protein
MKTSKLIAMLVLPLAALSATATPARTTTHPSAASCGGNLWRLKTLSDPARKVVRLSPRQTTLGAIAMRHAPAPTPTRRTTPFQKQTWEVVAQIVNYRIEDGELRMILFDDGAYINAAVPTPPCLPAVARTRSQIASTYRAFTTQCAHPTSEWQPLGAVAYIRGVGFWSQRRTAHGTAPNGAELHPVTGFRIVAGCG